MMPDWMSQTSKRLQAIKRKKDGDTPVEVTAPDEDSKARWLSPQIWSPGQCRECGKEFDFQSWDLKRHRNQWECPQCHALHHLDWKQISFHPAAEIFPMLDESEAETLAGDIKENGLREPITLYRDQIIDGRNRYLACLKVGVSPDFKQMMGAIDSPISFVISLNLHRRHLTDSQRAMVAARIADLKHGQKKADVQICTSVPEAAEKLHVSPRSVKTARKVLKEGSPELIGSVDQGEITVSAAVKQLEEDEKPKPAPKVVPPKATREETHPCVGMMHAENAIWQLEKIMNDDTQLLRALEHVRDWITKEIAKIKAKSQKGGLRGIN